jgi:hypothetical protein
MKNLRTLTLSDMCQCDIRRTGDIAEIIVDTWKGKPIRLMGFTADATLPDFEIYEQGFAYLKRLVKELSK